MAEETLTINITVNDHGAQTKLDDLKRRIQEIASLSTQGSFQHLKVLSDNLRSISNNGKKLDNVAKSIKAINDGLANLTKGLAGIKDGKFKIYNSCGVLDCYKTFSVDQIKDALAVENVSIGPIWWISKEEE